MSNTNQGSIDVLKKAFNEGYEAFNKVEPNAKGFMNNPANPYSPKALPFKEWERGYNCGYREQQQANKRSAI